jgi:apolipoprotein N-acyltransferase
METAKDWGLTLLSALLLILAFPNINFWPLAWTGLVPLLIMITRKPVPRRAFLFGWLAGSAFFYSSCYWLTYSMIHYAGISRWLAYGLLIPGAMTVGIFPALFALAFAQFIKRWGMLAFLGVPLLWVALEWARLSVTGQLWNALGYSQAFHPAFIQAARWGGVYAVGFLMVAVNAAIAIALIKRTARILMISAPVIVSVVLVIVLSNAAPGSDVSFDRPSVAVVALQPNVPMDFDKSAQETRELLNRHLIESEKGLSELKSSDLPRLVIWPESPMNFTYTEDLQLRNLLAQFSQQHHTSLLFNSQESAPGQGWYNSALLINEEGRLVAQYDKIRLMPFGEYVPLPRWLPGSKQVRAMVGEFTPGTRYTLMPVGALHAGVFICIESAYPWIARTFTAEGADVLINISNDGYLGPTAVMRQHLANTIFRAVENGRPLLRVTNTGITAYITPRGDVRDATNGFQTAVRTWTITTSANQETFYARHGDLFVAACALMSLLLVVLSLIRSRS